MKRPDSVAVVIPYYDHQQYIGDTIASVAQQTMQVDRVIIVDDGSPIPVRIDQRCYDLNLQVFRRDHEGLASARNFGFDVADTEYVIPLDSDDLLCSDFVEATVSTARTTNAPIVYTDIETFGLESVVYRQPEYDFARLCRSNFIVATSLIRRSTFQAVRERNGNGYDPVISEIGGYEDHLFYLEAGALGLFAQHIPRVLFQYRRRSGSMLEAARTRFFEIREYMRHRMRSLYGIEIGELRQPGEP